MHRDLAIRPRRQVKIAAICLPLAAALHALLLMHEGALLSAALVLVGAIGLGWGFRQLLRESGAPCSRLRLHSDGRVTLFSGNAVHEARLAPCSLRLGAYVLLVLRSPGRRPLRLLLGPGILSAPDLAALGRWLPQATGGEGTAGGSGVD